MPMYLSNGTRLEQDIDKFLFFTIDWSSSNSTLSNTGSFSHSVAHLNRQTTIPCSILNYI